jgi:hypothetical protein
MIFKRFAANLRAQNWLAIGIELMIVVIGVFVGTQVSNWNQTRLGKRATEKMIEELKPGLQNFIDFFETAKVYYATTGDYADVAFAGWRTDHGTNDEQFVIAAYQASQIYSLGLNAVNWSQVFGGDQLKNIDDPQMRRGLANLMTLNYDMIDLPAVDTPYRQNVREVIPEDIQDEIRAKCGDAVIPNKPLTQQLSSTCDLDLAESRWANAAAALRAQPELVRELRWHRAAVAAFLSNMELFEQQTRAVMARIGANDAKDREQS